jgi:hypothetical protein
MEEIRELKEELEILKPDNKDKNIERDDDEERKE